MSTKDISWIRDAMSNKRDFSAILDSALPFRKWACMARPSANMPSCSLETCPWIKSSPAVGKPAEAARTGPRHKRDIDALIHDSKVDKAKAARIKQLVGLEMEKRNPQDPAGDLFKALPS